MTSRTSAKLQLMAKLHIDKMFLLISDELIFVQVEVSRSFLMFFWHEEFTIFMHCLYVFRYANFFPVNVSCLLLFDNILALCIMCFQALLIMFSNFSFWILQIKLFFYPEKKKSSNWPRKNPVYLINSGKKKTFEICRNY